MKKIYILVHERKVGEDDDDVVFKMLGVFTGMTKILKGIEFYKTLPGFKDFPDGFFIEEFDLDSDDLKQVYSNMFDGNVVYLLEHYYETTEEEIYQYLGVYSTKKNAEIALLNFKKMPDFLSCPDGFCLEKYELNEKLWIEGFIIIE